MKNGELNDQVKRVKCLFGIKEYKRLNYLAKGLFCFYILLTFIWGFIYPSQFHLTAYGYDIKNVFNYIIFLPVIVLPVYAAIITSFISYPMCLLKYIGIILFTIISMGWIYVILWYRLAIIADFTLVAYIMIFIAGLINLCYLSMVFKDNIVFYLTLTPDEVAQLLGEQQPNI